jgi:hypothetical protein
MLRRTSCLTGTIWKYLELFSSVSPQIHKIGLLYQALWRILGGWVA